MKRTALILAALAVSASSVFASDGRCKSRHYQVSDFKGNYVLKDAGSNGFGQFNDVGTLFSDGAGHVVGVINNQAFSPDEECWWDITGSYTVSPAGWLGIHFTYQGQAQNPPACTGSGTMGHVVGVLGSPDHADYNGGGGAIVSGTLDRQTFGSGN